MAIIKALFLDLGGVLMTNGWDHALRKKTAENFHVDYDEMEKRHQLFFDTHETGKMSFDDYLKKTFFYEERPFSMQDVKQYITGSARSFDDMIALVKRLKSQYGLKVGVVSNEGRYLANDRIQRFNLPSFVDFFVVSSYVQYRKPDLDIYRLALDLIQVPPEHIVYLDDRKLFIEVAKTLGIHGIHHTSVQSTESALNSLLGLARV